MKKDIKYLLSHRNANNRVYMCDLRKWLGVDIDINKLRDIQKKLSEIDKPKK